MAILTARRGGVTKSGLRKLAGRWGLAIRQSEDLPGIELCGQIDGMRVSIAPALSGVGGTFGLVRMTSSTTESSFRLDVRRYRPVAGPDEPPDNWTMISTGDRRFDGRFRVKAGSLADGSVLLTDHSQALISAARFGVMRFEYGHLEVATRAHSRHVGALESALKLAKTMAPMIAANAPAGVPGFAQPPAGVVRSSLWNTEYVPDVRTPVDTFQSSHSINYVRQGTKNGS